MQQPIGVAADRVQATGNAKAAFQHGRAAIALRIGLDGLIAAFAAPENLKINRLASRIDEPVFGNARLPVFAFQRAFVLGFGTVALISSITRSGAPAISTYRPLCSFHSRGTTRPVR